MSLTRHDHLSDLAIERALANEGGDDTGHLADCHACRSRLEYARAFDRSVVVLPRRQPRRTVRWAVAGGILAAAAGIALVLTTAPSEPDLRAKGGALRVDVYVHDGHDARRVLSGARVHSGDRLGFRTRSHTDGYLLIFGQDARGTVYPVYVRAGRALPHKATAKLATLPNAIRLDDVPGTETLTSVLCPRPFGMEDVAPGAHAPAPHLPTGCVSAVHVLHKD